MFQRFFSRKFNNSIVYVLKIFLQWKILEQCKMCITFFFSQKSHNWSIFIYITLHLHLWVNKNTQTGRELKAMYLYAKQRLSIQPIYKIATVSSILIIDQMILVS